MKKGVVVLFCVVLGLYAYLEQPDKRVIMEEKRGYAHLILKKKCWELTLNVLSNKLFLDDSRSEAVRLVIKMKSAVIDTRDFSEMGNSQIEKIVKDEMAIKLREGEKAESALEIIRRIEE